MVQLVEKPCLLNKTLKTEMLHFAGFERQINKPQQCIYCWITATRVLQSSTLLWHRLTLSWPYIYYHKSIDTKSDIIFGQTTYPHGFNYEATKPQMA